MSSLTTSDLSTLAALVDFVRGPGHVLHFTDREFSQFFGRDIGVNIDDPTYAVAGKSKGKRLRTFLEETDNATARRTLEALWSARVAFLVDTGQTDPVGAAEQRYRSLLSRVGSGSARQPSPSPQPSIYESLKAQIIALSSMAPHARGYAFQTFLYGVFEAHGTNPRTSFRNRGEEIDGSFSLGSGPIKLLANVSIS